MKSREIEIQRRYYAETANRYDNLLVEHKEHNLALAFLIGVIDYLNIESVLDVGSGTGRAVSYIKQKKPDIRVLGIEPVAEMREVGYRKGISEDDLIEGDVMALDFDDGGFDLVCEFGVLHHIKCPSMAVSEMLRVARKAIFISDCNNFGQGPFLKRGMKQAIHAVGLWRIAVLINTRGRGYSLSDGDGLAYSYSVFDAIGLIRKHCSDIHILNTSGLDIGINPYSNASHIVVLGMK